MFSVAFAPPDVLAGVLMLRPLSMSAVAVPTSDADEPAVEALMEAYVQGDAKAFSQLYRRTAPKILGYLVRLARNRERAEDLLQVTFAKIHRARGSYLPGAPLLPWALAIARRSFFDEQRAAKVRREDLSFDGSLPEQGTFERETPQDVSEALERALDELPETYREAIQLTKVTGLSASEAARVLGTTQTAVKLRVHRGYLQLRKALEQFNRGSS